MMLTGCVLTLVRSTDVINVFFFGLAGIIRDVSLLLLSRYNLMPLLLPSGRMGSTGSGCSSE
jgi:hypothetical protein